MTPSSSNTSESFTKSRILHLPFYKILKLIENIMEGHNEDLDKEDYLKHTASRRNVRKEKY